MTISQISRKNTKVSDYIQAYLQEINEYDTFILDIASAYTSSLNLIGVDFPCVLVKYFVV